MTIKVILPYPNKFVMDYISGALGDRDYIFLFLVDEEQKIYKKNITLGYSELAEGDIWAVGAEVLKHVFRVSGVTKYNGTKQRLYSKEVGKEIEVGILIDPSIIQIYPHKEPQVLNAIKALLNTTAKEEIKKNYIIASTPSKVDYILDYISKADKLVIDLETTSIYPHKGKILLFVFSTKPHESFVIPADLLHNKVLELNKIFSEKHLIFHNLKFDYKWLTAFGFNLQTDINKLDDTMLMAYCIDENEAKGLKELALKYTDLGDYERELDLEKKKICKAMKLKVGDFTYDLLPEDVLGEYAAKDGDATYQLYEIFLEKVGRPEHYKLMLDYSLHLVDVELNGGYISEERLLKLENTYKERLDELEKEMLKYLPEDMRDFNPRSPKQVSYVLYDYLGFEVVKRTDAGAPSTDEEALEMLSEKENHPFFEALLKYRKSYKFYTTYVLAIKENLDEDGAIRTNFNITGTVSGRLSSSGTINFQNIPSKDKDIKKLFVPSVKDWFIYQQDLKTAEVWMAAYLSDDKFLQEVFKSGGDFHGHVAKRVFKLDCSPTEVKEKYPEARQAAKAINYTGRP